MLEKFLVLLERFVVAHELIAANSAKPKYEGPLAGEQIISEAKGAGVNGSSKELPVEGEEVIDTPPTTKKAKPAAQEEDDLADDEEEVKPKRKPRQKKEPEPEPEVDAADLAVMRDEIKVIAKHIAAGDSDQCADSFDEMLDEYKVRTVTKLTDEQVPAFHAEAKALVAKYYEIEE